MNIKPIILKEAIETVEDLTGTYDQDSTEYYDALEVVLKYAKQKVEQEQ